VRIHNNRTTVLEHPECDLLHRDTPIPLAAMARCPRCSTVFSQSKLAYHGLTFEESQAVPLQHAFHPDDWERATHTAQSYISIDSADEFEARVRRKDGTYQRFLIRLKPIRDDQGDITRWYAAATDIEDRKKTKEDVQKENIVLRDKIDETSMFEEIVGSSTVLRKVLVQVAKVASTDSTVLIAGETGTGKELLARAIHRRSPRSSRAFVAINCAAIPSALIASELFGHEKGAFTGALTQRLGRFELAEGGTLFLDEIGDLPMETQQALLRVLQEREFERVGGSSTIRANVRVIAATNRDLEALVREEKFRLDLFYRLNVFPLEVPPLRERRTDIAILAEYFVHRYAKRAGKRIRSISKETLALLQWYEWPGNIRELQNVIERAVIVSDSDTLSIDECWLSGRIAKSTDIQRTSQHPATDEKGVIQTALMESKGRVAGPFGAARRLGIPSSTLESKIKALKIDKHHFKSS